MQIKLIPLQIHGDDRGSLISLEQEKNIPFEIKRVYYIFDTEKGVRRGFHAHKELKQVAIAIKGSCKFLLDNGEKKVNLLLDTPSKGVVIEPLVWHEMFDFSEDCVLIVLADNFYDESDYIRDYDEFLEMVKDN